ALARQAWDSNHLPRLHELLERHRPLPEQEDFRRFEWYHLWHLCHQERYTFGHPQAALCVAVSPDGKTAASGGGDNLVRVWDTAKGEQQFTLAGHKGPITCLAFSAKGTLLATCGSTDNTAVVWDLNIRAEKITIKGFKELASVAFSP